MRVIRPAVASDIERRRGALMGAAMLVVGIGGAALVTLVAVPSTRAAGITALAAAVGLGVGVAWLIRGLRRDPLAVEADELVGLLDDAFDDSYVLVVAPRLPGVGRGLSGLLIGPSGVRVLTVRRWSGEYRVRGRAWHFNTRGPRGWIPCRTNPSFDADTVRDAVARWAQAADLPNLPLEPVVVFPKGRSRIVLEEPDAEIVTSDNVPWWAGRIGRAQRLDRSRVARVVAAVVAAADPAFFREDAATVDVAG